MRENQDFNRMSMANYGREVEVPIPREDDIPLRRDEYPSMREYIDEHIRLETFRRSRGGLQGTDFERWNQDTNRNHKKIFLFYKKLYEKYLDTITDEEIERILREQGLTDADRRVVFSPGSPSVDMIQNIIQGYRRIFNDIYGLTGRMFYPEGNPRLFTGGIFSPAHVQPYINDLFNKYMRLNKKIEIVMKLLDKCCKSSNFIDLKNEMEDTGQGNLFRSLFSDILPEASGKRKHRKTHKKNKSI
jgi:hypothetical protein